MHNVHRTPSQTVLRARGVFSLRGGGRGEIRGYPPPPWATPAAAASDAINHLRHQASDTLLQINQHSVLHDLESCCCSVNHRGPVSAMHRPIAISHSIVVPAQ
jgi:hypothetical protein